MSERYRLVLKDEWKIINPKEYIGKKGIFLCRSDYFWDGGDSADYEEISKYKGKKFTILGCACVNDTFENSDWDIEFEDGKVIEAMDGNELRLLKDSKLKDSKFSIKRGDKVKIPYQNVYGTTLKVSGDVATVEYETKDGITRKDYYYFSELCKDNIKDSKFKDEDSRDLDLSDLEDIDGYFRQYEINKWSTSLISEYDYKTLMNNCRTAIHNLCKLRVLLYKELEIAKEDYQNWLAMRKNSDYPISRYEGNYFNLSDLYVKLSKYIDTLRELRDRHSLLEANDKGLYNIVTPFKALCAFLS